MLKINPGDKILFTGDSITDCGSSLTEDIKVECVEKIRLAALEAHKHHLDVMKNNNPASK